MREFSFTFFLTFVLILSGPPCRGAPQNDAPPVLPKEQIHIVEDPQLTAAAMNGSQNTQYAVQTSLTWLAGQTTKKMGSESQTAFGLGYSFKDTEIEIWDVQAHWLSSKVAWIQLGKKFLFAPDALYEPYYRLALSHFADPDDALAGISRIDSFKGTAAVGVLDLASLGRIWTFEMGLHFGISGLAFHVQSGLQWVF